MPTLLDDAAERIAPTPAATSYFDPAAGQSVISRYANAGRRLQDSSVAADATSRLLQSRENRLADRQRQVRFDRDEEDYQEKKDFKIQRGQFLQDIAGIDPSADDFEDQVSQLATTLPQAALKDDAVVDMLHAKRALATDLLNQRQQSDRDEKEFTRRMQMEGARRMNDRRLDVLTPEERNGFILPNGDFDSVGAASAAYEKGRRTRMDDFKEKEQVKRTNKLEDAKDDDLDDAQKKLKAVAKEHTEGDDTAFPSQVEDIRRQLTKNGKPPLEADLKKDPRYDAARKYDSGKFAHELGSARNMKLEQYVAAGGDGLTDIAKQKRRDVWQAAQVGKAAGEALDAGTAASLLQEAGGDKNKARQIARERGYSF